MARSGFITRLAGLVCLLLVALVSRAAAQDIVLDGTGIDNVMSYGTIVAGDPIDPVPERPFQYFAPLTLEEARAALPERGVPAPGPDGEAEPWSGPVWVRITLANPSSEAHLYRFWPESFAALFDLDAWLVTPGASDPQLIWRQASVDEGYAARQPHTRLSMSEAFAVPPGAEVEIWFHFIRGYDTAMPMRLTEEQTYVEELLSTESFHTFLFGARAMLLVGIFAFAAILRLKTAFYYGLFALFIYLYFMTTYGYSFAYVFRNLPLNYGVGVLMGGLAMTAFTLMTRTFLNARAVYPRFNKILIGSLILSWIIGLIAGFIVPVEWAQLTLFPAILLAASVNFAGAILALVNRHKGAVLYFVAAVFLLALSIFGVVFSESGLMSYRTWSMVVHVGFTLDTILFAAALVTQAMALRQERDDAAGAEMAALRDKADLTARLSDAEEAHAGALALAEQQRRRAASTAHDLKQPLLSLRMALAKGQQDESLGQGLSYLE
ncbi:MAG: 7TM-DISM domain-containing protein, partial [Henriciella sp.]